MESQYLDWEEIKDALDKLKPATPIRRRRVLAASRPMPPHLAKLFTTGQLAALRIIADAVRENGRCLTSIAEIATRAGVERTTVQKAIRLADKHSLLIVCESNAMEIISTEWQAWIGSVSRP